MHLYWQLLETVKAPQEIQTVGGGVTKALECHPNPVEEKSSIFASIKLILTPALTYSPLSKFILIQALMTFSATFYRN